MTFLPPRPMTPRKRLKLKLKMPRKTSPTHKGRRRSLGVRRTRTLLKRLRVSPWWSMLRETLLILRLLPVKMAPLRQKNSPFRMPTGFGPRRVVFSVFWMRMSRLSSTRLREHRLRSLRIPVLKMLKMLNQHRRILPSHLKHRRSTRILKTFVFPPVCLYEICPTIRRRRI